ncbi:unnamed protein product [Porites lobata]|uniref:Alpha-2-macroglobulin n=1 Tax=Porites lobata TaxID=104759 RepID=A0ABN8QAK4_9CNID|nr:unnamed protein product [Porites lobata]
MKTVFVIFAALMVCYAITLVESGYLVTSPRIFRAGSTQRLSVSLFSVSTPWDVNATVVYNNGRGIIASNEGKFTSLSDGFLNLKIPKDLNAGREKSIEAKLMVTGRPVGGKQAFRKNKEITIEIPKKALFIQTDKPIYKPGQTVNMRIVGTDENLRPLTGKNPIRVSNMQWDNLDFNFGIISLKFPLSSQPVLGDWKIEALLQDEKKTLVFKVDKYVLPKFEVTITPPSFVAYTDRSNITATVCARYTYGQPVKGKVKVLFRLKLSYLHRHRETQTTKEKEIYGCTEVSISPGGLFRIGKGNDYPDYLSGAKVVINATVTETATGVTLNATETETQFVRETKKVEFLSTTPTSFKPGMAFTGQLKATLIDGSPLKGKSIELIVKIPIERPCWVSSYSEQEVFRKKYAVPENGVISFVVPGNQISQKARSLTLEANYNGKRTSSYKVGQRWLSPSDSYIEMEKITAPLKVGSSAKIMFDFTTSNDTRNINFHLQVFSRGKLVARVRKLHPVDHQPGMKTFNNSKNEDMFTSQGFIEFNVTQKMVPKCRLLLFYVRDDQKKETVADNLVIDVEDTLENKVNLRFADSVRKPGENTRIIITAAPGSQVALAAVDKSVYLLKGGNQLTTDDAINVLSSQDVESSGDYRSDCSGTKPLDASKAFKESGVIYFSDLGIQTARCEKRVSYCNRRRLSRRRCHRRRFGPFGWQSQQPSSNGSNRQPSKKQNKSRQKPGYVRKEFAEPWLWSEELVNDVTGKAVVMAKVPDTTTSWIASAFAMSNSSGLGVSKPATLKVFQSFFVSLTLPYSVIRGEEVSIIATVFNYESKCLTIRLGLKESLHYRILSNSSFDVCVCSSEAKSVRFSIIPKKLGQMPLKVVAKDVATSACEVGTQQMTLGVTDAVIRKLLVEPEGVRQEYTYNSFVCLKDESYFNDTIKIALPSNVVAGSVYAVVSTVGDLMGPTLNVEGLLGLPKGCGEQNMVNFAPSIYIMKYLSTVGQLTRSVENKAKNIMTKGYQRELTYKRSDGSYSAYGNSDSEGNTWLTAFVLRSFAQARPFIFVDRDELKQTQDWITKYQNPQDGCFKKSGSLFNKRLKGGVSDEATLTAFVTVSLLESGMSPESNVIQGALICLRDASFNLTDLYSLALFAYTFTLAKDPTAARLFKALQSKAIVEAGLMYWGKEKVVPPSDKFYNRAPAADIELTAYALMTYILQAKEDSSLIGQAMPIVRWLTKQRNALGGFASTQDTCVALQALSKYAKEVYSNTTSLSVRFGEQGDQKFSAEFNITEDNKMVSQRAEVPSSILPIKKLPLQVQGEGCALMQADVSYNIPDVKEEPAFDLKVKLKLSEDLVDPLATETGEFLCMPLEMSISAKWLKEDSSNMAVIDVKLVSGYQVDEESLDRLMNHAKLGMKRYEIEGQHVILYFDEIDKVSFAFKIYQSTLVAKTKPASVTVYDYYETHLSATVMYKITEDMCSPDFVPIGY